MAALKSQCPGCRKILKLKTKSALGKRVPCPQCNKPFIVEEYESPELVDDFIDDDEGETFDYASYEESSGGASADYDDGYDDYEDDDYGDDDYDEAPRRKSTSSSSKSGGKSKSKKNKKKKSAGMPAWLPMALMAGAGVAALAGIVGAIIAFMPGGSPNVIDLAWLPGDADGYMYVEPQEIWNAAVLAPLRENPAVQKAMNEIPNGPSDLKPTDIKSITMAITGAQPQGGAAMPNPLAMGGQTKTLMVMRLSKATTTDGMQLQATRTEYNGKEYYRNVRGPAAYLADPTTLLVGDEDLVKAAIDRGATEPRAEWMDFADSGHQFFMAMKIPTANVAATEEIGIGQTVQKAKAGYVGITLGSAVDIEAGLNCAASGDADLLETKLKEALAEAKTKMDAQGGQVPPQFATFLNIGKKVVNSVSASSSGTVLTVSASVPGEIGPAIADLAKNPFAAMGLAGMVGQGLGGFGSGASPPGFGGGSPTITPGQTGSTPSTGGSSNPLTGALDAARKSQSKNNLKQLLLGIHNYHDTHKKFPQSAIVGPDGKTTHSWRVAILPFLNQTALYNQYKLDEPWDSPANQSVMNQMPAVFRHPNDLAGSTNAAYFGLVGPETAMGDSTKQTGMRDVTDGTSNTIFLVEAKRNIPWSKPEDISYATGGPIPQMGGHHNGGYHIGLADGATRFLSASVDQNTLRNLINRKDGQVVGEF